MIAIATLLFIVFFSLIVVRVAAEALILTGLSREAARFQARSAWTGTGFTTKEAEEVVNHPVRRRIISTLMLLRSVGLVTAASTLMISFVNVEERITGFARLGILLAGLVALYFFARSQWVDRHLSRLIAWALKRYSELDTRDYAGLLHLAGEYAIMEMMVQRGGWMAGKRLDRLDLPEEGVLVLGVARRDGTYIGAPGGETVLNAGDSVLLYGRSPILADLDRRRASPAGDRAHQQAVAAQRQIDAGQTADRRGRMSSKET